MAAMAWACASAWADPCVDRLDEASLAPASNSEPAAFFEPFTAVVRAGLRAAAAERLGGDGLAAASPNTTQAPPSAAGHPWQGRASIGLTQPVGGRTAGDSTRMEAALMTTRTLSDGGELAQREQSRQLAQQALSLEAAAAQDLQAEQLSTLLLERDRARRMVLIASRWSRQLACAAQTSASLMDEGPAKDTLHDSRQHAEALERQARQALRQTSQPLRAILGDGLPLTTGLPAGRLSAALDALPSMTPQGSSAWVALQAQSAASDAHLLAQRAAWSPQWEAFAGARAQSASRSGSGSAGHAVLMVGLSLRFDLDRQRMDQAIDQARQTLETRKQLSSSATQWRQQALDERRSTADQAMNRARRIAAMLRDSESLGALTAAEWRQSDAQAASRHLTSMRSHFELQAAYVDAWHEAQTAAIQALALGGGLIQWLK